MLLKDYLILKVENSIKILKEHSDNVIAYNTLLKTIYYRIILLDRRSDGLQRMFLCTYEDSERANETYKEFNEVVSETDKIFLRSLKRVDVECLLCLVGTYRVILRFF